MKMKSFDEIVEETAKQHGQLWKFPLEEKSWDEIVVTEKRVSLKAPQ